MTTSLTINVPSIQTGKLIESDLFHHPVGSFAASIMLAMRSLALAAPLVLLICVGTSARAPPGSCATGVEEDTAATGEVLASLADPGILDARHPQNCQREPRGGAVKAERTDRLVATMHEILWVAVRLQLASKPIVLNKTDWTIPS